MGRIPEAVVDVVVFVVVVVVVVVLRPKCQEAVGDC